MSLVHRVSDYWHGWAVKHVPAMFVARPFECAIALILAFSGLSILLGVSTPQSAEKVLLDTFPVFYYCWAGCLLLGAIAMGWGLSSIRWVKAPTVYVMHKVLQYQLGMRLLALASFVFGAAVLINAGWNGLPSGSLDILFGLLCLARLVSLRSNV